MATLKSILHELRNALLVGLLSAVLFVGALSFLRRPAVLEPVDGGEVTVRRGGVPVLCYHFLRENTGPIQFLRIMGSLLLNLPLLSDLEVWTQTESTFDQQMRYLKENGYETIGMRELIAWRHGLGELPRRPVVITFDDGDRSVMELAYPILQEYGFTATLYVPTANVGKQWEHVDGLDWDEIRALQESGVFTIESHTHDLHFIVKTDEGAQPSFLAAQKGLHDLAGDEDWRTTILRDLRRSRVRIRKELGHDSKYLAWPFGFGSSELDSIAVVAGFHAICTLESGKNVRYREQSQLALASANGEEPLTRWQRFEIRRYTITARTSIRGFAEMLAE